MAEQTTGRQLRLWGLLGAVAGALALSWRWWTYYEADDLLYFFKVARLATGDPLPDPILNATPPVNYVPHPGGNWPLIDFAFEYPPGSIPFVVLPSFLLNRYEIYADWLGRSVDEYQVYQWFFSAQMVAVQLGLAWLLFRLRQQSAPGEDNRSWTLLTWGVFTAASALLVVRRFDAVCVFLAGGGLLAALRGRRELSGVLLGLGGAVKLWPLLLVPVALFPELRGRDWRGVLRLGIAALLGFLLPHMPFLLPGGARAFAYLGYHGARGIQIESTWANGARIVAKLLSLQTSTEFKFGAWNVEAPSGWTRWLVLASYPATLLAYGGALAVGLTGFARGLRDGTSNSRWVAAAGATVAAILLTAKVLSAQYSLWLFPFAFAVPGRRGRWIALLALVCCGLTYLIYPVSYLHHVIPGTWPGLLLVLTRNVGLAAIAGLLLQSSLRGPQQA